MTNNLTTKAICPGQDTRFWKPDDIFEIPCCSCGAQVEFFKDEARRRCPKCKTQIVNPKINFGCAKWCEHAKECLGFDPKEAASFEGESESLVDRLIDAMKLTFGKDQKRIDHALSVFDYARRIRKDTNADPKVVFSAAILHDSGIQEAERKHGSSAGRYQELEGPPIARKIMEELKLDPETIDHVCRIIANHHSAKGIDTIEFRTIWDADWIVNIPDVFPNAAPEQLVGKIDRLLKTKIGKKIARDLYANDEE